MPTGFNSTQIVMLAIVTAIGFVAFLIWELTEKYPIVDLSLFKSRNFALGTLAFCLGYAVFFANNLLMPLWLQTQVGYTATWAGLVAAPTGAIAVLLTPLTARLMSRVDARIIATVAFLAFAASYLHARRLHRRCRFLQFRAAAAGAGHRHGDLLPGHDHHSSGWRAAAAHSPGFGRQQFRPHHGRRLCRFGGHHPVGPARGAASEPAWRTGTTIFSPG